ncbi:ABC transporter permease [Amphritea balenae]|nr:ABC transporter permease [Amphritea balenae]
MLLTTLIISSAARQAFTDTQQTLGGQAVAHLLPKHSQNSLPEQLYRDLRLKGVSHIMPIAEGRIKTEKGFMQIRGLDLFPLLNRSSNRLPNQTGSEPDSYSDNDPDNSPDNYPDNDLNNYLFQFSFPPYLALVSESYAQLQGLKNGQQPRLADTSTLPEVRILKDSAGLGYFILCDIRCAQKHLGLTQRLTSILITHLSPTDKALIKQLSEQHADLVMADKSIKNPAFTDAFLLNLQAIGLLAFLVGCFIAFNAVSFSVLQRQQTVKQMRLSGATANEIVIALLFELSCWALLASIVGSIIAWLLSTLLLPGIGFTLERLFFNENILILGRIQDWWGQAITLSLAATIIATLLPLIRLARQPPMTSITESSTRPYSLLLSLTLLGLGSIMAFYPSLIKPSQWSGLVITASWFIGGALLVPSILTRFYQLFCKFKGLLRYPALHWMLNDSRLDQQRQGIAMTAFCIAIAACIAVLIMVSSFRQAFTDYLDVTLPESLYLTLDQNQIKDIKPFLSGHPDVELVYPFFMSNALINQQPGLVRGLTNDSQRQSSFILEQYSVLGIHSGDTVSGDITSSTKSSEAYNELWRKLHQRKGIIVNQALALNYKLKPGDRLSIVINNHPINTEVLGIYFSYGSLVDVFAIDQQWLMELWPQLQTNRLGVFIKDDSRISPLLTELTNRFQLNTHHYVLPGSIKQLALSVFQRTFHATQLLSVTILLIAAIGVYCASYTAQLEKQIQYRLVHILGLSSRKIACMALLQLFINASLTCMLALPLGILVAWASTKIVLRYAFGWYFDLIIDPLQLSLILFSSIAILLAGALLPFYLNTKRHSAKYLTAQG